MLYFDLSVDAMTLERWGGIREEDTEGRGQLIEDRGGFVYTRDGATRKSDRHARSVCTFVWISLAVYASELVVCLVLACACVYGRRFLCRRLVRLLVCGLSLFLSLSLSPVYVCILTCRRVWFSLIGFGWHCLQFCLSLCLSFLCLCLCLRLWLHCGHHGSYYWSMVSPPLCSNFLYTHVDIDAMVPGHERHVTAMRARRTRCWEGNAKHARNKKHDEQRKGNGTTVAPQPPKNTHTEKRTRERREKGEKRERKVPFLSFSFLCLSHLQHYSHSD